MISCKERDKESNSVIKFNNYSFFVSQAGGKKNHFLLPTLFIFCQIRMDRLENFAPACGKYWA